MQSQREDDEQTIGEGQCREKQQGERWWGAGNMGGVEESGMKSRMGAMVLEERAEAEG